MRNSTKLDLTLNDHEIHEVEKKSSNFFRSLGFSDHSVQVPVMILRELIKNAIKYGKCAPPANEIAVRLQTNKNTYTIEVMNPVDETCSDRLRELDKTIQFIRGYQDPYEAYSIRLAEIAARPYSAEANDLGLVKIAYEGGAILDFFVSEDNFLVLSAVGSPDGDGRI